jgi:hypothetical protein
MKNQFAIQIKKTGGILRYFDTLAEAQLTLAQFEEEDKKDDVYVPDFYEIAELTLDGTYTPVES